MNSRVAGGPRDVGSDTSAGALFWPPPGTHHAGRLPDVMVWMSEPSWWQTINWLEGCPLVMSPAVVSAGTCRRHSSHRHGFV
jgi:hypothetical protein